MSKAANKFTYERLLEWALRLEAEGSDWGRHLALYSGAWRDEVIALSIEVERLRCYSTQEAAEKARGE